MRYVLLICFTGLSHFSWGQTAVSSTDDKNLATLMNKTEGSRRKQEFINDIQPQSDFEEGVVKEFERYYHAMMTHDTSTMYNMMSNLYRKVVDYNAYVQKERYQILKVHLRKAQFEGETCALVRGYMMANTAQLGEVKLPLKLYLFNEDGAWHVYANPYENLMFTLPEGKSVKKPCTF
jgi:hypothetical protein